MIASATVASLRGRAAGFYRHRAYASSVSLAVEIIVAVVTFLTVAFVLGLFVWAAKKDGEQDDAVQKRLGIKRRTWLGR